MKPHLVYNYHVGKWAMVSSGPFPGGWISFWHDFDELRDASPRMGNHLTDESERFTIRVSDCLMTTAEMRAH